MVFVTQYHFIGCSSAKETGLEVAHEARYFRIAYEQARPIEDTTL
jgi:hypothetical protein